jgi:TolA-binding protein
MTLAGFTGALLLATCVRGEDDPNAKKLDDRLKADHAAASRRSAIDGATSSDAKAAAMKADRAARAKDQDKKDAAEAKQMNMDNLGHMKELFAKAEDLWKNKSFGDAGSIYSSVSLATVPGSEEMAETSRNRMLELEDIAKTHLKAADDADLKREYVTEVNELSAIHKDFSLTKTCEVATRRLVNLKSRPEIAGYVDLAEAETLETDNKLTEAVKKYEALANNPRYEHSVPAMKAKRKLDELNKNEATRTKIKEEADAKAEKEAPKMLLAAKNFVSNNQPKQAIEKLQMLIEKFPTSKYADEAKKQLGELK